MVQTKGLTQISPIDLDIMCYIYRENKKGVVTDLANIQEAYKDKMSAEDVKKMLDSLRGVYIDMWPLDSSENPAKVYTLFDTSLEFIEWANQKFFEKEVSKCQTTIEQ